MFHLILSPAKSLNEDCGITSPYADNPLLLKQTKDLAKTLKKLSAKDLEALMGISPKLAALNYQRFQNFKVPYPLKGASPCLFMFQGDVYKGLEADSLSKRALEHAHQHLSILSGFYGLLRPFDNILAYRLEMGTPLSSSKGKNLYEYWGKTLQDTLYKRMKASKDTCLLNLASQEYFKALLPEDFPLPIVDIQFKNLRKEQYKIISFLAKKARGKMARYILTCKPESLKDLQKFSESGYRYCKSSSDDKLLVFKSEE